MESRREPQPRRSRQRSDDPLDRRLDQWLETGRQLVDGVAGTRPGRRGAAGRSGHRLSGARLDAVGRWVGDKIDWLLDEDDDDWGGPWDASRLAQATPPRASMRADLASPDRDAVPSPRSAETKTKRPLEAMSRRQPPLIRPAEPLMDDGDWPDDASFRLERWQRTPDAAAPQRASSRASSATPLRSGGQRPLPRSSRRRG
ncbi:MAG: RNA helicase [Synechococcus sp.]